MAGLARLLTRQKILARLEMLITFDQRALDARVRCGIIFGQNIVEQFAVGWTGRSAGTGSFSGVIRQLVFSRSRSGRLIGRRSRKGQDRHWKQQTGEREEFDVYWQSHVVIRMKL